jgi:hypothetical protein
MSIFYLKKSLSFSLFFLIIILSCKKIDKYSRPVVEEFPKNWKEKFFHLPENPHPALVRAADEMRRQSSGTTFLENFVKTNGFIKWDKADIILKKHKRNIAALENGENQDTLILLPTVPWMEEIVKSIVAVKMDGSVTFKTYLDKYYQENGFDFDINRETPNAEDVVKKIMEFENKIFGAEMYKVTDQRLFKRIMTAEASTESFVYKIVAQSIPIDDGGECITYTSWITEDGGLTWTELDSWDSPSCSVNPIFPSGGGSGTGSGDWGADTNPVFGDGGGSTNPDSASNSTVDCIPWVKLRETNGGTYDYDTPVPCITSPFTDPAPCDSLILSMQNDTTFISKFKFLNSASVLNLSYERGFTVKNRSLELYYAQSGTAGTSFINWNVSEREEGYIHSHYRGLNSIFSGEDIVLLARVFLSGNAKDSANLFFGVTSYDGMPYLIKVGNVQQFREFAVKIVGVDGNDLVKQKKFIDEFTKVSTDNSDKNEKEFLKILKKFGNENSTTLFRGNSDCNEWTRIKIDGFNDIISKQCF